MMKALFTFILLIAVGITAIAQQYQDGQMPKIGEVNGKITDAESGEPLEFATVAVYTEDEDQLVTGSVSDAKGSFSIREVPAGSYYIKVDFLGYDAFVSDAFQIDKGHRTIDIGDVYLGLAGELLDAVEITEQKSQFVTKLDRKVFDVKQDIASKGGDALNVLENVPSVEVDIDGNISLRGDGNVRILIDGRPSAFTASDILRQLPADAIDRVEIITNPSAKYDPEGNAGILNIITKKERAMGINGNANANFGYGETPKTGAGLGLNLRNQNINIYGNIGYNYRERQNAGVNNRFVSFADTSLAVRQNSSSNRANESYNLRGGIDYFLDDNNTLYTSITYNVGDRESREDVNYNYFDFQDVQSESALRTTSSDGENSGYQLNAGWQRKFDDPNHTLDIDLNLSTDDSDRESRFNETNFDINGNALPDPERQVTNRINDNAVLVMRADYVRPIWENGQLEAGLRVDYEEVDEDFQSRTFDYDALEFENDDNISNRFLYKQEVYAAYATLGSEKGKFNYQLGLRAEQTEMTSELITTDETFVNNYFSLFPSVNLAYKVSKTNTFTASYSRRINRPRTRQLNPFTDFSDPENLRAGNPFLEPEFVDAIEVGHQIIWDKVSVNSAVYYQYITDQIRRFLEFDENGISTLTYENIGEAQRIGAEIVTSYRPFKWWTLNLTGNYNYYELKASDVDRPVNNINEAWSVRLTSRKTVWKDFRVQVDASYRAPRDVQQGSISSFQFINVGLSKSFLNRKLTVNLNVRDIFDWMEFEFVTSANQGLDQVRRYDWESRVATISVSYNFGQQIKGPKRRQRRDYNRSRGDMDAMQ